MRKKRKVQLGILTVITGVVIGVAYFTQNMNDKLMAAPPVGYSDFITTPGVNAVDINATSKVEISGDYALKFRISDKITYEPIGASKVEDIISKNTLPGAKDPHNFRGKSQVISFNPKDEALYPERAVWIRRAAIYKGREVDIKMVIDKLTFKYLPDYPGGGYPDANFFALDVTERNLYNGYLTASDSPILWEKAFLMMGGRSGSANMNHEQSSNLSESYTQGDTISYHYEFYDSKTKLPLAVKGIWNYNNINQAKQVKTDFDGDFSNIFVATDATVNLGYQLGSPPVEDILIFGSQDIVDKSYTRLDKMFQETKYTTAFSAARKTTAMLVMYETESLARIAPANPVVIGSTNSQTHKDPNYLNMNYTIIQDVADNRLINRNNKFVLETTVPDYYDIDVTKVKVSSYGNADDLTNLFTIAVDPANASRLLLTAKDPTTNEFNGKVFDIKVSAKPNSTFNFDKVAYNYQTGGKDDGYMLFEQGLSAKVHYEVNDSVTGLVVHNKDITSEITDESMVKVLYEGIPDGDPKKELTFPRDTDFSKIDIQTAYLDNLRVDTENAIDEPVTVTYKNGKLPDSSVLGPQKVTLILTTAKEVSVEKEVTITITDISATLTVKFIGELTNELHVPITLEGNTTDKVDLTIDKSVQTVVSDLVAKGYTKLPWDNADAENATPYTAGTVIYKFQGNLALDSVPATLNFGKLTYDAKTKRVENPIFKEKLVVSDTRANPAQGWHLTATLTSPMTNNKGQELVNALRYVEQGQETILDANAQVIYANNEGKDGKFAVSDSWGTAQGTDGIKLQMNSSDTVYTGDYIGTITWKIMAGQP
ncbi:hypothetical protein ATZ33_01020 [Enterococcus silesiacus]|nr:WxL domain-containing protein [Enterococcus silesiacus]ALS00011.1 hypothetical protein ATZ33_01020 [Enterococcus silesiacus]